MMKGSQIRQRVHFHNLLLGSLGAYWIAVILIANQVSSLKFLTARLPTSVDLEWASSDSRYSASNTFFSYLDPTKYGFGQSFSQTSHSQAKQISSTLQVADPRLVIDLSRRVVTLYDRTTPVKTYAVAVGRQGWETPEGEFQVIRMLRNPTWIHPMTNARIAGSDRRNPLGGYWIGFWTDGRNWVGFHGTPNPESVGQAISHGCIRMHNQDIQELFQIVRPGTSVSVIP